MTLKSKPLAQLCIGVALLVGAVTAQAETIDCTAITTLPYVINSSGIYCLTGDLNTAQTNGPAITINVNNVTLDLNGWRLGGLAAGTGTWATGIYATNRKNITIKNGTIRGFFNGIWLDGNSPYTTSQGHVVEGIRAEQNRFSGIVVAGQGSIVRNNQVVDTGGSTISVSAIGITLYGPGTRTLNNDVINTTASANGIAKAVYHKDGNGAVIEGNRIDGLSSGTGSLYGIIITNSNTVLVVDNRLTNSPDFGIMYINSTGKYMNNLTSNVGTPFFGGTAVGTNN